MDNTTTDAINGNTKEKDDPSLFGDEDVAELLKQLSNADSMAQGMESKVDSVLQNLDELLALLGAQETSTTSGEDAGSTSRNPSAPDATKTSGNDP